MTSFAEHQDGITCPSALVWVHDHGVYLMSSGLPRREDPNRPGSSPVVYAHGWYPAPTATAATRISAATTSPAPCASPTSPPR
ncbi:hypothetical protein ACFFMM_11485 [Micromonospora chaiyaphumensis]|uniref:hypothetical protein n=1 Tax=Micromonospora chaiyaphumensis TaxID=307119 RepID=UPI000B8217F0|nr:hypothetical protein [Micromonospora chaiyaphumensis]